MSDIYIDVDTAVAIVVNKVPLIDDSDFKSREVSIAYNQAGMDLVWNFTTSAGVVTQTAVTPTTAGDYDWTHVGDAVYKVEIPASGGASINNDAEGYGFFGGICTGVLAWVSPIYTFRAAALNNALIDGGDTLDVNTTTVSGTAQTANDNGADINAVKVTTDKFVFTVANEVDSNVITKTGFSLSSTGLDLILVTSTFVAALIKGVWDRVLTGATHNDPTSAGRRLRGIQENGSVYNGEVHVDTNNGVTGVVPYENGTSDNATLTWAEALIIAPLVNGGLSDFHLINGSSITFTSSMANKSLFGDNYTVALAAQNCSDVYIQGANVSGIGTAATGEMHFEGCRFGTASIQSGHGDFCAFADTITHTLAGGYQYHNCYSGVAGAGAPIFTKTAGQTITSEWRNFAGSITVSTIESGDVMTIGGTLGTVTLNGADGTVEIRGTYKAIIDNRTGSPTLNTDGAMQSDALVTKTWSDTLTTYVDGEAGKRLKGLSAVSTQEGTVDDVSATTTSFTTTLTGLAVNALKDGLFEVEVSPDEWEGKPILSSDAVGGVVLSEPLTSAPANGVAVVFSSTHIHPISQIQDGLATEAKQDVIDANVDLVLEDTSTTLPALIDDLAIKKNTAGLLHIEMVLASDHVTPATGLTVTAQRLIDSGTYASVSGTMTEISNGTYRFDYLAADANGDIITWKFSAATADDTKLLFKTVA